MIIINWFKNLHLNLLETQPKIFIYTELKWKEKWGHANVKGSWMLRHQHLTCFQISSIQIIIKYYSALAENRAVSELFRIQNSVNFFINMFKHQELTSINLQSVFWILCARIQMFHKIIYCQCLNVNHCFEIKKGWVRLI